MAYFYSFLIISAFLGVFICFMGKIEKFTLWASRKTGVDELFFVLGISFVVAAAMTATIYPLFH